MPAAKSDDHADAASRAKFTSNTAAAMGAMTGAVGASIIAPAVPIILATTLVGFVGGKLVGEATADRKPD